MMLAAFLLAAAQAASGDGGNLSPATAAAIVAGGKACVGVTVDAAGEDARLTGWNDATGAQKAGIRADGRVVMRDNVMLISKTGVDGGCVVQAKAAADFDKPAFLAALGAMAGVPVATDPKNPVTKLSNGEILIVQVGEEGGATFVQLVVANPNGKYAKVQKGN